MMVLLGWAGLGSGGGRGEERKGRKVTEENLTTTTLTVAKNNVVDLC